MSSVPVRTESAVDAPIPAPPWHTAALVGVILAVAVTGTVLTRHGAPVLVSAPPGTTVWSVYLPTILVQWTLALYVARVGRPRSALRSLLGSGLGSRGVLAWTLALAAAGWVVVHAIELVALTLWPAPLGSAATAAILPRTPIERALWVPVACSVGFCEELTYRGYLQTCFTALTRGAWSGVLLQAVLFGIAHAEQGAGAALRTGLYGVLFGVVALWRRSLWPTIVCHVSVDLTSGL